MSRRQLEARLHLVKGRMNRLVTLANEVEKDKSRVELFRAHCQDISKLRAEFEDGQIQLASESSAVSDESASSCDAEVEEFDIAYYRIQEVYARFVTCVVSSQAEKKPVSNCVKLPKLQLPTFSGETSQWTSFFDLFNALVHENKSLSDVEKHQYLLTSLSGDPFHLIKNLPLSTENYELAWKTLTDRYQDVRKMATVHWENITRFPVLTTNPLALRKLVDVLKENLGALRVLKFPVNEWSFVLLNTVLPKLDSDTRCQFELAYKDMKIPSFDQLLDFLEGRCKALVAADLSQSAIDSSTRHTGRKQMHPGAPPAMRRAFFSNFQEQDCVICHSSHAIYICPVFASLSTSEKREKVRVHNLCFNCLKHHKAKDCTSTFKCAHCARRHHSLLHSSDKGSGEIQGHPDTEGNGDVRRNCHVAGNTSMANEGVHDLATENASHMVSLTSSGSSVPTVILGTALVQVQDAWGNSQQVRVLLDSGSQSSFISENCVRRLGLQRRRAHISVLGLGQSVVEANKGLVTCTLSPCQQEGPQLVIDALILKNLTSGIPCVHLSQQVCQQYTELQLADPGFHTPGPVDLLLGADVYPEIFDGGRYPVPSGYPAAFHTIFGWVLMGRITHSAQNQEDVTCHSYTAANQVVSLFTSTLPTHNLSDVLRQFWESEELPPLKHCNPDDLECEQHFLKTHSHDSDGRFTVRLPFKCSPTELGVSRPQAVNRLHQLERRLTRNPALKSEYCKFLQEYQELGHMHPLNNENMQDAKYYIPHHCVLKESSSTTKLRVVFDASAPTSSGNSLNDILRKGPRLQNDVVEIITKFRLHPIVLTADICKMYRQIHLHPEDKPYQVILWRENSNDPIQEFQLDTVTYGVSAAPFLAMRSLQQLALEEKGKYPKASHVLMEDIFVDDVMTGASTVSSALELQRDLVDLLKLGGFELRKWSSNHESLLQAVPENHRECPLKFQEDGGEVIKVLGVLWDAKSDRFSYHFSKFNDNITKRGMLSNIAQIYDPLGWIAPVVFQAKLLLQNLWLLGIDWDEALPSDLKETWRAFIVQVPSLGSLRIPRYVSTCDNSTFELHGFSDASINGYSAVVYLRVLGNGPEAKINILIAKTRVAPLKTVTLPRLELLGAHLLVKLFKVIDNVLSRHISISTVTAWCDSTVALSWIRTSPHRLKTFVANRVSQIQECKIPISWRHVPSHDNPADCASRGLMPKELLGHQLWWQGPRWLACREEGWPTNITTLRNGLDYNAERKVPEVISMATQVSSLKIDCLESYSSWLTLLRVLAYIRRFLSNLRIPRVEREFGPLTPLELESARKLVVKQVQQESFKTDLENLDQGKGCSLHLRSLDPFLDKDGIMRVGGRLHHSTMSFDEKHAILLPKESHITNLVIDYYHKQCLHGGLTTTLAVIRSTYWILSARRIVKSRIHKCLRCWRFSAEQVQPIMGSLPANRVTESRPFLSVGVDFGGPFQIKGSQLRNARILKAYLCLFVCLATKAVHLEVVSSLSTKAFLNAFYRFVSRRGLCKDVYSDCGTNFIGARRHLSEMENLLGDPMNSQHVTTQLSNKGIQWHLNPPAAPHFGGIWEAGVKAAKHHLKRVVGQQVLTFEELTTLFVQIEAVLNSRPLCAISSDPNDLDVLTPAHFVIGKTFSAPPSSNLTDISMKRLDRYQLLQQSVQHFWLRWSKEYLNTLQQRVKWRTRGRVLNIGDLVVVKEDNLPPLQWQLGRVDTLYPGKDGVARVADIKTARGLLKRPVVKLCHLPAQ